ncbi:O-antigen ligase family protein [Fusibacter sp. JL216-2]|uniref:O-antigen ligase family protein n=1 Tax=Fusibacter sp. JL216-2 TaxID=3071453 RepID=UPI003D34E5DE
MKNVLIAGYFLSGWLLARKFSKKKFVIFGVCMVTVFSGIGIFSKTTGNLEWAMDGYRLISTVNDPNVAGFVCLIGLLFCWKLLDVEFSSLFMKITIIFVGGFSALASLFLTGSRTSILGLGVVALLFVMTNFKRWKTLILLLSVIFFSLSGLYILDNAHFNGENYRYLTSRFFNGTERASEFRSDLRGAAFMMGKDHCVFGVGPGQFPNFSTPYYKELGHDVTTGNFEKVVSPKVPHNTYVTYFAERGILGLILFMVFLGYSLVRNKGPVSRSFLALVMTFALFFNIENLRILWLIWGGLSLLYSQTHESEFKDLVENESQTGFRKIQYSPKTILSLMLIFSLSLVTMGKTLHSMYRPYVPLLNHSTQILVGQEGLDLIMEYSGGPNDPLFINFEGKETHEWIIRNRHGFYKDTFNLPPGGYTMTLSSGSGQKKFIFGLLKAKGQEYSLYNELLTGNLIKKKIADVEQQPLKRYLIPTDAKRSFDSVNYEKVSSVYLTRETGVNFEDKIQLDSISLRSLEEEQYEMVFEFTKTGQIDKPFMFLTRGYDLRDSRKGKAQNIAKTITFDPVLTELEIGQTFTGTWTFNTEGRPYMLQYSFYYKDPETGEVTQPYPKWVLDGYVQ